MKFNTKQEAQTYLEATYPDYALTGVYRVVLIGGTASRFMGIDAGYYVNGEID